MLLMIPSIYKTDLSDRKEMVEGLLSWLTPEQQWAYLDWCCQQLPPIFQGTRLDGPIIGGKKEAWLHLCTLCTQFRLNFEYARAELERLVKQVQPANGATRMIGLLGWGE
jgi:hypothetical protein